MKSLFALFSLFTFSYAHLFSQFPPETYWGVPQTPTEIPNPAYLESVTDQDLNLKITRISDADVFRNEINLPELGFEGMQHQYAKTQAWNADMSLIHLGTVFFLNADDYTIHKTITSASLIDSRWSNTDPNIIYYGEGENFMRMNVHTEETELLHHFPGYQYVTIGPWEGNITKDDKYVVITSYDSKHASIYDIENDVVLASKVFNGVGIDWASFTPSGDYVVVSNNETDHTEIYDLNFNYQRDLVDETQHADFAIDQEGNEVMVQVIELSMIRLSDGLITDLIPASDYTSGTCGYNSHNPNIGGHVSGRAFDIPGWALVSASTHECSNDFAGYYWRTEMFMIKLDGSGIIRSYGYSRTSDTSYTSSTKASISPDGKKVIFASDWGTFGDPVDPLDYIVEYIDPTSADETPHWPIPDLYPNPAHSSLYTSGKKIEIFDLAGRRIHNINIQASGKIDISHLAAGTYFLKSIQSEYDDQISWQKFIKQ